MFGYTDRIRGDRGPGDHKGSPLPWTNGPGEPIQVYAMACLFRFRPYEFPAGWFGVSARAGQGEHKASPLLWTIVPGGPLLVFALACFFPFLFLRISGGLVWGERAGGVAGAGMGAGY